VSTVIYIEGGGSSKELHARCREGFRKLLDKSGLASRSPRLVACGSRDEAFDDFKTACRTEKADFIALLIDSEDPISDIEATWSHLKRRDHHWEKPSGAANEQVLFMTTCMETWIIADRPSLKEHYGHKLQESALPVMNDLESRPRQLIQNALEHATRDCLNRYSKGKRSFEILAKLKPEELEKHLRSFLRVRRILNEKC
jgi:hypothetical protein